MKKTLLSAVLAAIMILTIAVPAFAFYDYQLVEPFYDGLPLNDKSVSAEINILRSNFTPSRNVHNNSVVVMNETNKYFKWVGPQWLTSDTLLTTIGMEHLLYSVKRPLTLNGFAGFIYDYGNDALEIKPSVSNNDGLFTEWAVANDTTSKYVLHTGMGFTFLKDSASAIRFYFMYQGETDAATGIAPINVMYYDYETTVDLTSDFHEIHMYYDAFGTVLFFFDNNFAAKILFANEGKYSNQISYIKPDGKTETFTPTGYYAKSAALYGSDGKLVGEVTTALIAPGTGNMNFAIAAENDEIYINRYLREDVVELPIDPYPSTLTPVITTAPETTKKAEKTSKATTTNAPETTASPEATKAPETTKAAETKSGCGSVAAIGVAVVVSVLGCAIIRRKH